MRTPQSALVAGVERRDVVADVVPDDHAVPQVVEKARQRLLFLDARRGLSSRVMPCTVTALVFFATFSSASKESSSRISPPLHGDGADRDDAIGARIEPGGLGIEHDEPHLIDRRVVGPGGVEALAVAVDERAAPS